MAALPKSDPVTALDSAPALQPARSRKRPPFAVTRRSPGAGAGAHRRGAMSLHRGDPLPHLRDRRLHHLDRFDGAPPAGLSQAGLLPDLRLRVRPRHSSRRNRDHRRHDRRTVARRAGSGARCPNCGEDRIDLRAVPPNHGDQLLVQKNVYEFRKPRRWEVVVLKSPSPSDPLRQAGPGIAPRVGANPQRRHLRRRRDLPQRPGPSACSADSGQRQRLSAQRSSGRSGLLDDRRQKRRLVGDGAGAQFRVYASDRQSEARTIPHPGPARAGHRAERANKTAPPGSRFATGCGTAAAFTRRCRLPMPGRWCT